MKGFSFFKKGKDNPIAILAAFYKTAEMIWREDPLPNSMMTNGRITIFIRRARQEDVKLHNAANPHKMIALDKEFK